MATRDPLIHVMMVMTSLLGAIALFLGYVVFFPSSDAPAVRGPVACDPRLPDEEQCAEDEWCIEDTCALREVPAVGQRGEHCHDRLCGVGLQCMADNRCHPPGESFSAPSCASPEVRGALARLASACAKRKSSVKDLADGAECSIEDWKELLADDAEIATVLAAFPDRFAVYFPVNEPRRRTSWPGAAEADVMAQLAPHRARLKAAKQVFLIGRASPDGNPTHERALATRRLNAVMRMLEKTLGWKSPIDRDLGPRLIGWASRSERMIAGSLFIERLAGPYAPITTSATQSEQMAAELEKARRGGEVSSELERQVNRTVLVVPILCPLEGAG